MLRTMNLPDAEMLRLLILRDGPLRRSLPHDASGACRYAAYYPDADCPWCAAVRRRNAREAAQTESKAH